MRLAPWRVGVFALAACSVRGTTDAPAPERVASATSRQREEGDSARLAKAREDCDRLLATVLVGIEQTLMRDGALRPFGATMDVHGAIALDSGASIDEQLDDDRRLELLRARFHAGAVSKKFRATALVFSVRPGAAQQTNAVTVVLDHRDNYSNALTVPYAFSEDRRPRLGAAFSNTPGGSVFQK